MALFGGLDPEMIAGLVGSGYATWVRIDQAHRVVAAHGARVVAAPAERVFDRVTDFAALSRELPLLARPRVIPLAGDQLEVHFEARVGLALFKLSVPLRFRFRREAPVSLHFEDYLGGAFTECVFAVHVRPLDPGRSLLILEFHGDVRSLGLVARMFLARVPELELAIAGNMVVLPLVAMGGLVESHEGIAPPGPTSVLPLQERLAELAPILADAYLPVGRLGEGGRVVDVCAASRVAATPERLWPIVSDPARLAGVVSFVEGGGRRPLGGDRVELSVGYKARFGPLRKRYALTVRAREEAPHRLEAEHAEIDGVAATYGDVLVPVEGGCLYAHRYATDLQRDWLSRKFLGAHPELERLIAQYPPLMQVHAVRRWASGA